MRPECCVRRIAAIQGGSPCRLGVHPRTFRRAPGLSFNAPMTAGDPHPRAYALQPASGAQIWTASLGAHVSDRAASATAVYAVVDHTTPASSASAVVALKSATGAPLWEIPLAGNARIALG